MERGHRSPVATFYTPELPSAGGKVTLGEAVAHHAGVRRLSEGDRVRLTDGRGTIGLAFVDRLAKRALSATVEEAGPVPPRPLFELLLPVADRDRMLWLAEKSTELGISIWQPVVFARSRSVLPRGEGEGFAAKVRARMIAALEQSGGAWLPEIRRELSLSEAATQTAARRRYVLDQQGARLSPSDARDGVAVAVGPEGGFEAGELEYLCANGWQPVGLGPTTLRFETAGIAAIAILRVAALTAHGES